MKLIIQIPCYNEAETLEIALNDLPKQIDGIDEIEYLMTEALIILLKLQKSGGYTTLSISDEIKVWQKDLWPDWMHVFVMGLTLL